MKYYLIEDYMNEWVLAPSKATPQSSFGILSESSIGGGCECSGGEGECSCSREAYNVLGGVFESSDIIVDVLDIPPTSTGDQEHRDNDQEHPLEKCGGNYERIEGITLSALQSKFKDLSTLREVIVGRNKTTNHYGRSIVFLIDVGFPAVMKISTVSQGDSADALTEINIMSEIQEKLILTNVSPCFVESIFHLSEKLSKYRAEGCDKFTKTFAHDLESDIDDEFCTFQYLLKEKKLKNEIHFNLMEECHYTFREGFDKICGNDITEFKTILFMMIHALESATRLVDGFTHGDLHTENVMLFDTGHRFNFYDPTFLEFAVGRDKVQIPFYGIIPKIIDFGFSSTKRHKTSRTDAQVNERVYPQYDLLYFVHFLLFVTAKHPFVEEIINLMDQIDDTRSYVRARPMNYSKTPREWYAEKLEIASRWFPTYHGKKTILHAYS